MEQKKTDVKNETFEAKTRKLTLIHNQIAKNTIMEILFSVGSRVGPQLLDKKHESFPGLREWRENVMENGSLV